MEKLDIFHDVLQPLPIKDWSLLKTRLKRNWPRYAYFYYWLDNAIKWKQIEPNLKLNIYTPDGKILDSGIFVGIESYTLYLVTPFAFPESKLLLEDCLIKTNQIDWSERVVFDNIHEDLESSVKDALDYLEKTVDLQIDAVVRTNCWFKTKEDCLKFDVKVPADVELKLLQPTDAELIHELWPRVDLKKNPEKSLNFISTLIRLNYGLGLYKKDDSKLIAWLLKNNYGGIGPGQVLAEHRKKGYAKVVASAMAKRLATEGLDVTTFIRKGNVPSEKLVEFLNFKRIHAFTHLFMKCLRR